MNTITTGKVKIFFVAILIVLILILVAGVTKLEGGYYWQKQYLMMQLIFLRTRIQYLVENPSQMLGMFGSVGQEPLMKIDPQNRAQSVPVLLYHGVIADPTWKQDDVSVRFSDFERQMILLKSFGYQTVSLDDFLAFLAGKKNLPPKSFLLTFDDGRKDSYYPVDPVLRALGYRATMFVITGRSLDEAKADNTFHLDQTELQKMVDSGRWDIGSHTKAGHNMEKIDVQGDEGHFLTNKLWLKFEGRMETDDEYKRRVADDLAVSKNDIEENLHVPVKAFAFPFGDYGLESVNYPQSKNYLPEITQKIFPYSFYQVRSSDFIGNYPHPEADLAKRLPVTSAISAENLVTALMNAQDKPAANFADKFVSDRGWMEGWGKRQFQNGLMLTGPSNSEDSSLTFLEGSYLWKDYTFKSQVQLMKGKSFALLARYHNGDSYVSCDYGAQELFINEHKDGNDITLADVPFSSQFFAAGAEAGISVKDQSISCLANGKTIGSAVLAPEFSFGGIGFKTWDNELHNSELLVKSVEADGVSAGDGNTFRGAIASER